MTEQKMYFCFKKEYHDEKTISFCQMLDGVAVRISV